MIKFIKRLLKKDDSNVLINLNNVNKTLSMLNCAEISL